MFSVVKLGKVTFFQYQRSTHHYRFRDLEIIIPIINMQSSNLKKICKISMKVKCSLSIYWLWHVIKSMPFSFFAIYLICTTCLDVWSQFKSLFHYLNTLISINRNVKCTLTFKCLGSEINTSCKDAFNWSKRH